MTKSVKVCVVVDISGSMAILSRMAQDGVNKFIEDQKKVEGKCSFDLYTFNTVVDRRQKVGSIKEAKPFSMTASGGTAMNDAICLAVSNIQADIKRAKHGKPLVLFLVVTDGQENSSKLYTTTKMQEMVKDSGFEFTFLCADPVTAKQFKPLGDAHCVDQQLHTQSMYNSTSSKITRMREQNLAGEVVANVYTNGEKNLMGIFYDGN